MKSVTRLANLFRPTHYDLSITLHREARTFEGVVTIQGELFVDDEIRLHSKGLTIHSALIDGKEAALSHDPHDELVLLQQGLIRGSHVIVVSFSGGITDTMNGVYPCYFEVNGEKKEVLATQFESHYARQAFPCIDEPEAKATFDVTLTTEKNITVLGNMPIASQREENGALVTTFETTPIMSSSENSLDTKVVLITGGARRIGAAIARVLHAAGLDVIIHYRHSADAALALQEELHEHRPGSVALCQADLTNPGACETLTQCAHRAAKRDALRPERGAGRGHAASRNQSSPRRNWHLRSQAASRHR